MRWCGVVVVLLLACAWCRAWFWGPFLASGHHHPPSHLLDTYKSSRRCCYPRTYHGCHRTIEQAGRRLPLTLSAYQSTNRLFDEITTTVLSTCQLNNRLVSSQPCLPSTYIKTIKPPQAGGRLPPHGRAAWQHHGQGHLLLLRRRPAQEEGACFFLFLLCV